MTKKAKNPVERRIEILQQMWWEKSTQHTKVFVWDMDDDAENFIHAFTALQQHETEFTTPDLFIKFRSPFDTQFGYSRALRNELLENYRASKDELIKQQIATDWKYPPQADCDSVDGLLACLGSFADYYQVHFRYLVVVLSPDFVNLQSSFLQWMQQAIQREEWPINLRIMLQHNRSNPVWHSLAEQYPHFVQLLTPELRQRTLLAEIANQSTEDNTTFLYRRYMTDSMILLQHGTPQQVAERAQQALVLAQQKGWAEQQVVMHSLMAGAWLKARSIPEAVQEYRSAASQAALIPSASIKHQLTTQSLLGEAGAWLTGKHYEQAAQVYAHAATEALRIPHPVFAIEGYRMAAYCHRQDGNISLAAKFNIEAIRVAAKLPASERKLTTLGVVLQTMLSQQDEARANALEKKAAEYSQHLETLQRKAEEKALALGKYPQPEKIAQLEQQLEQAMEQAFVQCCQQRETLICQASPSFQKIVFIGRELLALNWSGVPDIVHPLNKNMDEWSVPLSFMTAEPQSTERLLKEHQPVG